MIKTQKKYINYLEVVTDQLQNTNIDTSRYKDYILKIKNTELIVPVVGGFSAGKSTLINQFLGEEILDTGLTPETALATELRFSSENYFEAITKNNESIRFEINQKEEIKNRAKEFQFLKLYLNNPQLNKIQPLILVDMPGFDAPIELHNQAILNYLNKGIYFIILTSIEDGNITKSIMREIDNILEFGKDYSFCLSKTNLRPENDVKEVKDYIENQLQNDFDFDKPVICVGDKSGIDFENILINIDVEKLFEKIYLSNLKTSYFDIESSLNVIISTFKSSKDDSLKTIQELKNSLLSIYRKKENLIEDVENKFSSSSIEAIVNSVGRDLSNNKENLVSILLSNKDTFSSELNAIVQNVLTREIKREIKDISDSIVNEMSYELKNLSLDSQISIIDINWATNITNNIKDTLTYLLNGLDVLSKSLDKAGSAYKTITTILAISTKIINPVLELVLVFAPTIINTIRSLFGKSKEYEAKEHFETKIIPQVKSEIRRTLPSVLDNYIIKIIELISNEIESQIQTKQSEIEITQNEIENNIENIETEISRYESIKKNIQDLSTQNLFKEI